MRGNGHNCTGRQRQESSGSQKHKSVSLSAALDFAEALHALYPADSELAETFFRTRDAYAAYCAERLDAHAAADRRKLPTFHFTYPTPGGEPIELERATLDLAHGYPGRTAREKLDQWLKCERLAADFELWQKRTERVAHRKALRENAKLAKQIKAWEAEAAATTAMHELGLLA